MPKSIPMLDPSTAPVPEDLLYLVEALSSPDRDRKLTLADLLKALMSPTFQSVLGDIAWSKDQPFTSVPAWRQHYPSGELEQGWLNLRDVFDQVSDEGIEWNLGSGDSGVDLGSYSGGLRVRVAGAPTATHTFIITGSFPQGREILFFVASETLAHPCVIKHGAATLATVYGGELVRVHFIGSAPVTEVVAGVQFLREAVQAVSSAIAAEVTRATTAEESLADSVANITEYRGLLPRTGTGAFVATDGVTTKDTNDSIITGTPASFFSISAMVGSAVSRVSFSLQFGLAVPFSAGDRYVEFAALVGSAHESETARLAMALAASNPPFPTLVYHNYTCTMYVRKSDGDVRSMPAVVQGLPGGMVIRPYHPVNHQRLLWSEYEANFGSNTVASVDFSALVPVSG